MGQQNFDALKSDWLAGLGAPYYFAGDSKADETHGQGSDGFNAK